MKGGVKSRATPTPIGYWFSLFSESVHPLFSDKSNPHLLLFSWQWLSQPLFPLLLSKSGYFGAVVVPWFFSSPVQREGRRDQGIEFSKAQKYRHFTKYTNQIKSLRCQKCGCVFAKLRWNWWTIDPASIQALWSSPSPCFIRYTANGTYSITLLLLHNNLNPFLLLLPSYPAGEDATGIWEWVMKDQAT